MRHEVMNREGVHKVFTEELLFILRPGEGDWRMVEVREVPLQPSKEVR